MSEKIKKKIEDANNLAIERVLNSQPFLVDIKRAIDVLPGMKKNSIFHAGPPIEWKRMCGPLKGAIVGTMIYEGLASNWSGAVRLIENGEIEFSPNHDHDAVGPMAGVISSSLPVLVVKNKKYGNICFGRFVENKVQFGVFDKDAIQTLKFWSETLAPAIGKALRKSKGVDLKGIMARALHMGDELHNRPAAGTLLFASIIVPYLINVVDNKQELLAVTKYLAENEIFFLCMSMAACKAIMNSVVDIEYSTLLTLMARNGTDFGIKVSGLGSQWFMGPANMIEGIYFPGYGPQDANPDIGDSAITETAGVGAFALADSPAILSLIGGSAEDAIRYTEQMREITMTQNNSFSLPILNFAGTATGIDFRKVLRTGITPVIDTAIAHREPGIGMIGAGLVRPPIEAFKEALHAFGKKYNLM
ncbi:MAG: DUF1116 domain-containing protein [Nitrososphaeraceae archaeon]|nr:DUF1116 domain-containing protein [Nitrososphaeraceae archaeon]